MRKILFLLAFILPMACSFVSCSSDDEPTKTELTSAEIEKLQGTWNATDVSIPYLPAMKFLIKGNQLIVFEKSTGLNFTETGTYSINIVGQTFYLSITGYSSTDMAIELSNIS